MEYKEHSNLKTVKKKKQEETVLRWVSSGGGWRAMAASMGFANVFKQAGLIDDSEASKFSAMSFNSGSAWFATQFFYSQNFFELVVGTAEDVSNLVYDWMQSYIALQERAPVSPLCTDPNGIIKLFQFPLQPSDLLDLCDVFVSVGGSWAAFIEAMLSGAAKTYGDPLLPNRTMRGLKDKIISMSNTDLFIQTTLAPNSRSGIGLSSPGDNTYLADTPQDGKHAPVTEVYAVPLAAQFSFKQKSFQTYVGLQSNSGLSTVYEPALAQFFLNNYSEFGLYPAAGGTVTIKSPNGASSVSPFREPFGGHPTVTQIAAASSAILGITSGSVPSVLAQDFSVNEFFIKNSGLPPSVQAPLLAQVANAASTFYSVPLFEDTAICSQWPADCGTSDGRFLDGGFSDGLNLALNIGQYQTVDGGSLDKTIKVIMSNNNFYEDSHVNVLSYFNATFNAKVAPGDFIWAPATAAGSQVQNAPWRSYQIFEDYLDDTILSSCLLSFAGSQLRYCFMNATTIDNAYFGVKAGQKVEILLIEINSDIPTLLIGRNVTKTSVEPLVNLTREIATNMDLVSMVKSFAVPNY